MPGFGYRHIPLSVFVTRSFNHILPVEVDRQPLLNLN